MFAARASFRSLLTNKAKNTQRKRGFSTENVKSQLVYKEFGQPENVISLQKEGSKSLGKKNVRVQMLAAPINTYDVDIIKGKLSGQKTNFPVVGGTEGVGKVVEVTADSKYSVGDWVIPTQPGAFGTWSEEVVVNETDLLRVPNNIPQEYAGSLAVAPTMAYVLLDKFAKLKEGDVIIQSAGNSMVGQTIAQLAALKGIKTISIIRHRDPREYAETVERMKYYDSYLVVPDTHLNTPQYKSMVSDLPAPSVAFDCVGGNTATDLARSLKEGGTFVSYGSYSRYGLRLPTSAFIFNDITVRGFSYQQWLKNTSEADRLAIINELSTLVSENKLRLWLETYKLDEHVFALPRVQEKRDRKIIFTF